VLRRLEVVNCLQARSIMTCMQQQTAREGCGLLLAASLVSRGGVSRAHRLLKGVRRQGIRDQLCWLNRNFMLKLVFVRVVGAQPVC
jgi:hypothetical protein